MSMPGVYNRYGGTFRYVEFNGMLPYPYTMHEHFEIFRIQKGSLTVTIDDVLVTLEEGDVSLTAPFVFHKSDLSPEATVEMMNIAPYLCSEVAHLYSKQKPRRPYMRKEELPPLVANLLDTIPRIVQEMARDVGMDGNHTYTLGREKSTEIQPYLSVLLLELTRCMELIPSDEHNITSMQKVLKFCTANFTQEITRHIVARDCNVSLGMISQTFNRLGTSFRDYVNTLRINRAYQLLITTQKPITEIIYECGYSNQGTFNRNFQAQFGKSPRDIRHGK